MIIIGLTGSMAMGKSTAAKMLADIDGVAVHCSDIAVRELYNNRDVIELVKTTFPNAYYAREQKIDKKRLLAELGTDHEKWNALEAILHPFVQESQQKFIQQQCRLGTKIVVLDIPLLFETGAENRVDYTVCVSAPEFIQKQRIEERIRLGKVTEESAAFRLERQMPDAEKRNRANFVVPSGGGLDIMRRELEKLIRDLKGKNFGNGNERNSFPSHRL